MRAHIFLLNFSDTLDPLPGDKQPEFFKIIFQGEVKHGNLESKNRNNNSGKFQVINSETFRKIYELLARKYLHR